MKSNTALAIVNTEGNEDVKQESNEVIDIKRRGRPAGTKAIGYIRKSPKWEPKKWKPIYEQMVYRHFIGESNTTIADAYGYTDQQVSNIINSSKGQEIKSLLLEKGRSHFLSEAEKDSEILVAAATQNVKLVLTSDEFFRKAPLAIYDRSLAYLKAAGKLNGDKPDQRTQNNVFIGNDVAKILAEGLKLANQVSDLHQKK